MSLQLWPCKLKARQTEECGALFHTKCFWDTLCNGSCQNPKGQFSLEKTVQAARCIKPSAFFFSVVNCIISYHQPAQDAQDCLLSFASIWVPPRTGWPQGLVILRTEALLFFKAQQSEFKRQEALLRYPGIICVLPLKAKFVIKAGISEQPASAGHLANKQRGHALWHWHTIRGEEMVLLLQEAHTRDVWIWDGLEGSQLKDVWETKWLCSHSRDIGHEARGLRSLLCFPTSFSCHLAFLPFPSIYCRGANSIFF